MDPAIEAVLLEEGEEPSFWEKGLNAVGSVLGAPKHAVDALARASAKNVFGLPVEDDATVGTMVRSAAGLQQGDEGYGGALGGKAAEIATDVALDPTTWAMGGLGSAVSKGRTAQQALKGSANLAPGAMGALSPAAAQAAQKAVTSGALAAPVKLAADVGFTGMMGIGAAQEGMALADTLSQEGFTPKAAEEALGLAVGAGGLALGGRQLGRELSHKPFPGPTDVAPTPETTPSPMESTAASIEGILQQKGYGRQVDPAIIQALMDDVVSGKTTPEGAADQLLTPARPAPVGAGRGVWGAKTEARLGPDYQAPPRDPMQLEFERQQKLLLGDQPNPFAPEPKIESARKPTREEELADLQAFLKGLREKFPKPTEEDLIRKEEELLQRQLSEETAKLQAQRPSLTDEQRSERDLNQEAYRAWMDKGSELQRQYDEVFDTWERMEDQESPAAQSLYKEAERLSAEIEKAQAEVDRLGRYSLPVGPKDPKIENAISPQGFATDFLREAFQTKGDIDQLALMESDARTLSVKELFQNFMDEASEAAGRTFGEEGIGPYTTEQSAMMHRPEALAHNVQYPSGRQHIQLNIPNIVKQTISRVEREGLSRAMAPKIFASELRRLARHELTHSVKDASHEGEIFFDQVVNPEGAWREADSGAGPLGTSKPKPGGPQPTDQFHGLLEGEFVRDLAKNPTPFSDSLMSDIAQPYLTKLWDDAVKLTMDLDPVVAGETKPLASDTYKLNPNAYPKVQSATRPPQKISSYAELEQLRKELAEIDSVITERDLTPEETLRFNEIERTINEFQTFLREYDPSYDRMLKDWTKYSAIATGGMKEGKAFVNYHPKERFENFLKEVHAKEAAFFEPKIESATRKKSPSIEEQFAAKGKKPFDLADVLPGQVEEQFSKTPPQKFGLEDLAKMGGDPPIEEQFAAQKKQKFTLGQLARMGGPRERAPREPRPRVPREPRHFDGRSPRAPRPIVDRTPRKLRSELDNAWKESEARMAEEEKTATPQKRLAPDDETLIRERLRGAKNITAAQAEQLVATAKQYPEMLPDILRAAAKPKVWEKAIEAWKMGLLSGPSTWLVNLSDAMETGLRIGESAVAPMIDKLIGGPRSRFKGEAAAELRGAASMVPLALGNFARDIKKAFTLAPETIDFSRPVEFQVGKIGGAAGRFTRIPARILQSFTDFLKTTNARGEIERLALRKAHVEKAANPEARAAQIIKELGDLENTSHMDIIRQAEKNTREKVYQGEPGPLLNSLLRMRQENPWMHLVLPFLEVPGNITKLVLQRTPVGFVRAAKAHKAYTEAVKKGSKPEIITRLKGEAVDAITRPLLGTTIIGSLALLAKSGVMTGGGSPDPKDRNALLASGAQPYSFKVKTPSGQFMYVPFSRFQPAGSLLGFAADIAEASDPKVKASIFEKALNSIGKNVTSQVYLQGLSEALEFASKPNDMIEKYSSSLVGSMVPNILGRAAQAADPVMRETRGGNIPETLKNTIQSRLPGLSKDLPGKMGLGGEPIERHGTPVTRFISPTQPSWADPDQVDFFEWLSSIDATPAIARREMQTKRGKVKLTPEEYEGLSEGNKEALEYVKENYFGNDRFMDLPPERQKLYIQRIFSRMRREKKTPLMGEIVERANAAQE